MDVYNHRTPHHPTALLGRPAEVTALDHCIASRGGTTSKIEKLPSQIQVTKYRSPPNRDQRIEELTRENGYLRQELALYEETRDAMVSLHAKTKKAYKLLREGLQELSEKVAVSEKSLLKYWGIDLNDEGMEVTVI
jgi:hypothetical protein